MTDKEKIREEVERLFKENRARSSIEGYAAVEQLRKVLAFIDSLEVKEVDLNKEIDNIWNPRFNLGWNEESLLSMNHEGFTTIVKHFFELGLKAQKGE